MIPLGDASRRLRRVPIITILIIITNILMFIQELQSGPAFILRWSFVPANFMTGQNWNTALTAMFMHAGWVHLIGNLLFLWAFGPEIEDAMGPLRYLLFYLLSGIAATAAQVFMNPISNIPNLGASGAIAGVMGAFLITYPGDRIRTIVFFGWFAQVTFIPAALLIGFWFVIQLFNQFGALAQVQGGGVAYMAHIGGFLFGLLTAWFFETRSRRQS